MYAFQLWREYKLSLAEIFHVFPSAKIVYHSDNIALVDLKHSPIVIQKVEHMWGVIKLIEIEESYNGDFREYILSDAQEKEWKFAYGISFFGSWTNLKRILMDTKNMLKQEKLSARFINKDFQNVSSAQIIGEKLCEKRSDYSLIQVGKYEYFGRTVWVQDIEKYSQRDYGKTRDMEVGMLPPKLAQMMIHFSQGNAVYDPFCGLWTILIESILMQHSTVYGSDISGENIQKTKDNISYTRKNFYNQVKTTETLLLDAKWISSSPFLKKSDALVTEGYLGQIFQKYSVTEKKLEEEKKNLCDLYSHFFQGLKKANYKGTIVISFPFWEMHKKYFYFSEIYEILSKYCKILHLLPSWIDAQSTKSGSLLYKRPDQVVGREIFKLKIK